MTMASTASASSRSIEGRGVRLPYLPALDGLRALAVLAVVIYHAGAQWLPGGFVGVEVFFVISGYLITSLLLVEWRSAGRINFGGFWLRRARRLLPALFLLLLVLLALAVIFQPGEVAGLRKDAAAATGYVTNWYLVLSQKSYFESVGRPSLLRHLWSLAVEEQFYLVWPLLFSSIAGALRPRRAIWVVLAGAALSVALMFALYRPDVDPSRIYYGTDTRAAGLLLGAALALVWAPGQPYFRVWWQRRRLPRGLALDATGTLGLVVLAGASVRITEFQPSLYRGGFLLVDLATLLVILAAVHPDARAVPRLLGLPPLRWTGIRSYGIYLWHWPILMLTRPGLDVPLDGLPLIVLQAAAIIVAAALSFRFVETPVRQGALERSWRAWRDAKGERRRWLGLRWASGALGFALCFAMLGQSIVRAEPPVPPAYLAVQSVRLNAEAFSDGVHLVSAGHGRLSASDVAASVEDTTHFAPGPGVFEPDPRAVGPGSTSGEQRSATVQLLPICQIQLTEARWEAGAWAAGQPVSTVMAYLPARGRGNQAATSRSADSVQAVDKLALDLPEHGRAARRQAPANASEPARPPGAGADAVEMSLPPRALPAASGPGDPPPVPEAEAPAAAKGDRVIAIGDSVMIGAAPLLQQGIPNLDLDARIGRQASAALELLRARREADQLGPVVVMHVGNNGTFSPAQFDELMRLLASARRVVIVNLKVPRPWEEANNVVLSAGVKRYPNAVLVDWRAASVDHRDMFWDDGIHLRPEGARVYAALVVAAVKAP
ncbi:MAG TPA: acyltransferase family protein [Anaerolineae bacterium]